MHKVNLNLLNNLETCESLVLGNYSPKGWSWSSLIPALGGLPPALPEIALLTPRLSGSTAK